MTPASEVWLFGSAARGDVDARSDVDVLVAGPIDEATLEELAYPADVLSVVQYSWAELEHMAGYGSLFLQHVRAEGRPVRAEGPSRLSALMTPMSNYTRADSELASFGLVLDDVQRSLSADHSPAFELSVIATALRHACILGCYAIGRPTFGRNSAFEVFLEHVGRSDLASAARRVYEFRLHEDGRAPIPFAPTTEDVRTWLGTVRDVLAEVERSLRGDVRAMS
jgi:predicted nucleotidyltransferase